MKEHFKRSNFIWILIVSIVILFSFLSKRFLLFLVCLFYCFSTKKTIFDQQRSLLPTVAPSLNGIFEKSNNKKIMARFSSLAWSKLIRFRMYATCNQVEIQFISNFDFFFWFSSWLKCFVPVKKITDADKCQMLTHLFFFKLISTNKGKGLFHYF